MSKPKSAVIKFIKKDQETKDKKETIEFSVFIQSLVSDLRAYSNYRYPFVEGSTKKEFDPKNGLVQTLKVSLDKLEQILSIKNPFTFQQLSHIAQLMSGDPSENLEIYPVLHDRLFEKMIEHFVNHVQLLKNSGEQNKLSELTYMIQAFATLGVQDLDYFKDQFKKIKFLCSVLFSVTDTLKPLGQTRCQEIGKKEDFEYWIISKVDLKNFLRHLGTLSELFKLQKQYAFGGIEVKQELQKFLNVVLECFGKNKIDGWEDLYANFKRLLKRLEVMDENGKMDGDKSNLLIKLNDFFDGVILGKPKPQISGVQSILFAGIAIHYMGKESYIKEVAKNKTKNQKDKDILPHLVLSWVSSENQLKYTLTHEGDIGDFSVDVLLTASNKSGNLIKLHVFEYDGFVNHYVTHFPSDGPFCHEHPNGELLAKRLYINRVSHGLYPHLASDFSITNIRRDSFSPVSQKTFLNNLPTKEMTEFLKKITQGVLNGGIPCVCDNVKERMQLEKDQNKETKSKLEIKHLNEKKKSEDIKANQEQETKEKTEAQLKAKKAEVIAKANAYLTSKKKPTPDNSSSLVNLEPNGLNIKNPENKEKREGQETVQNTVSLDHLPKNSVEPVVSKVDEKTKTETQKVFEQEMSLPEARQLFQIKLLEINQKRYEFNLLAPQFQQAYMTLQQLQYDFNERRINLATHQHYYDQNIQIIMKRDMMLSHLQAIEYQHQQLGMHINAMEQNNQPQSFMTPQYHQAQGQNGVYYNSSSSSEALMNSHLTPKKELDDSKKTNEGMNKKQ